MELLVQDAEGALLEVKLEAMGQPPHGVSPMPTPSVVGPLVALAAPTGCLETLNTQCFVHCVTLAAIPPFDVQDNSLAEQHCPDLCRADRHTAEKHPPRTHTKSSLPAAVAAADIVKFEMPEAGGGPLEHAHMLMHVKHEDATTDGAAEESAAALHETSTVRKRKRACKPR